MCRPLSQPRFSLGQKEKEGTEGEEKEKWKGKEKWKRKGEGKERGKKGKSGLELVLYVYLKYGMGLGGLHSPTFGKN